MSALRGAARFVTALLAQRDWSRLPQDRYRPNGWLVAGRPPRVVLLDDPRDPAQLRGPATSDSSKWLRASPMASRWRSSHHCPPQPNEPVSSQTPTPLPAPPATARLAMSPRTRVFPYRIDFENAPTATAPAQRVVITDQLDPNLDWTTLQLTGVGFGDTNIVIPPDSQYYATTVPMTEQRRVVRRRDHDQPESDHGTAHRRVPVDRPEHAASARCPHRLPAPRGRHRARHGIHQLHHRSQVRPADRYPDPQRRPDHVRRQSGDRHRPGQR